MNLVELSGGEVSVKRVPLKPIHEMRCIKGRLQDLTSIEVLNLRDEEREDYLQVTLTDKEELIEPMSILRSFYPNVLQLLLEKNISEAGGEYESRISSVRKSTAELFGEFYEMLRGEPLDERRLAVVEESAHEAEEEQQKRGEL